MLVYLVDETKASTAVEQRNISRGTECGVIPGFVWFGDSATSENQRRLGGGQFLILPP